MQETRETIRNLAKEKDAPGVYIGRAWAGRDQSEWANPFKLAVDTDAGRRQAVWDYFRWILDQPVRFRIHELRGQPLLCWCAPKLCHGHALAFILAHQEYAGAPCPQCGKPTDSRMNYFEEPATRRAAAWNLLYEQGPCPNCRHYRFRHALRNFTVADIERWANLQP